MTICTHLKSICYCAASCGESWFAGVLLGQNVNQVRERSAEQTAQQGHQSDANQGNAAASHQLFYTQLGVKLCSMAGGGVQKIYMVFLREPSRRDRSGSDLFHLWDGFEIKMNFDRNVSCFIFVNAFMHDDFFD